MTERSLATEARPGSAAEFVGDVFFYRPRFPDWDYHPTGQLSLEFESVYLFGGTAPRRSFRDAKIQRLETMASEIAVSLAVLAAAKTQQRLSARKSSEEPKRSGGDVSWQRASSTSKIAEPLGYPRY